MTQRFSSKVDAWIMVLCFGPLVALLVARLAGVPIGRPAGGVPVALLVVLTSMLVLVATTSYVVTDDAITVWFGPIRRKRPLTDITRLKASRRAESSPAWSLDRVEIFTARGFWLLVSPSDKAGFVRAVLERAPHVQLDDALTRLVAADLGPQARGRA
ncbi:MAG: PH domain-containing protein [Vicinamibacterales bacterium]